MIKFLELNDTDVFELKPWELDDIEKRILDYKKSNVDKCGLCKQKNDNEIKTMWQFIGEEDNPKPVIYHQNCYAQKTRDFPVFCSKCDKVQVPSAKTLCGRCDKSGKDDLRVSEHELNKLCDKANSDPDDKMRLSIKEFLQLQFNAKVELGALCVSIPIKCKNLDDFSKQELQKIIFAIKNRKEFQNRSDNEIRDIVFWKLCEYCALSEDWKKVAADIHDLSEVPFRGGNSMAEILKDVHPDDLGAINSKLDKCLSN